MTARRSVALALAGVLTLGVPALAGAQSPPGQPNLPAQSNLPEQPNLPAQPNLPGPPNLPAPPTFPGQSDSGVYIISTQSGATYVGSWRPADDQNDLVVTLENGAEVRLARAEIIQMIPQSQLNPFVPAPPPAFAAFNTQVELHRLGIRVEPGSGMELRLERQNPRVKADSGWETACTESCPGPVDNRFLYRIAGDKVTTSNTFHIGGAATRLSVTPGDKRKYRAGLGLLIAGAVVSGIDLSVGLQFLSYDTRQSPVALPVVAGVGVTGLGMLVVGVVLLKTQGTKVQVEPGPELRQ